nr:unnamed protein product [Digitaria exilis]
MCGNAANFSTTLPVNLITVRYSKLAIRTVGSEAEQTAALANHRQIYSASSSPPQPHAAPPSLHLRTTRRSPPMACCPALSPLPAVNPRLLPPHSCFSCSIQYKGVVAVAHSHQGEDSHELTRRTAPTGASLALQLAPATEIAESLSAEEGGRRRKSSVRSRRPWVTEAVGQLPTLEDRRPCAAVALASRPIDLATRGALAGTKVDENGRIVAIHALHAKPNSHHASCPNKYSTTTTCADDARVMCCRNLQHGSWIGVREVTSHQIRPDRGWISPSTSCQTDTWP